MAMRCARGHHLVRIRGSRSKLWHARLPLNGILGERIAPLNHAAFQNPRRPVNEAGPPTSNLNVSSFRSLVTPRQLKHELPMPARSHGTVAAGRDAVRAILEGRDRRFLAVVGPCSIHDVAAAREYATRLAALRAELDERIEIVMRAYFEKPRTAVGWKGLINDPDLDESFHINRGLRLARKLLLQLNDLGLPTGSEFLDTQIPQHIADLASWAAIGARTTESQVHRELASGLSMPVGFKNSTGGDLQGAINALESARHPHSFLGINQDGMTSVVHTGGNPDGHLVLRGGRTPNYDRASVAACEELLRAAGLPARIVVDCSHAQTRKDHTRQAEVLRDLTEQIRGDRRTIMGFMLESNIGAGSQPLTGGRASLAYGVSITDPCIDWDTTARCLQEVAQAVG